MDNAWGLPVNMGSSQVIHKYSKQSHEPKVMREVMREVIHNKYIIITRYLEYSKIFHDYLEYHKYLKYSKT